MHNAVPEEKFLEAKHFVHSFVFSFMNIAGVHTLDATAFRICMLLEEYYPIKLPWASAF